jgi:hypothetical protein
MSMILIEAWVAGTMPILLHRATEESLSGDTRTNTVGEKKDPRTIAEEHIYRIEPSKQIAVPGGAFARLLREAGGAHKVKGSRKTLKYLVPAAVIIMDDLCGLYLGDQKTKLVDFEVDSRPVTIPATKGRVMRHRARCNEWACRVALRINDTIINTDMIRRLLIDGGQQIGIGDFRPEKGGPFGVFDVVHWADVSTMAKTPSAAQKRNGDVSKTV